MIHFIYMKAVTVVGCSQAVHQPTCSCRCPSVQVHRGRSVALFPGPTQILGVKRWKIGWDIETLEAIHRIYICVAVACRGMPRCWARNKVLASPRAEECRIAFPTCWKIWKNGTFEEFLSRLSRLSQFPLPLKSVFRQVREIWTTSWTSPHTRNFRQSAQSAQLFCVILCTIAKMCTKMCTKWIQVTTGWPSFLFPTWRTGSHWSLVCGQSG